MQHNATAELFRWIVSSSTDGLWIFDDAGITTYANDRLAAMLGRVPEEMPGLPVTHTLDGVAEHQLLAHLEQRGRAETGPDNVECTLVRADGTRIRVLVSHCPLLDDDGVRRGWLHRVNELTDRRPLLEEGLVTSEPQLAEASTRVGSWGWDLGTGVVTWSEELYRIFGYDPREFEPSYEGFLDRVHLEDRAIVEAAVKGALAGSDAFDYDVRITTHLGEEGWIRGRGDAIRDERGAPVRMAGTCQEITDSVLAAQELAGARDAAMNASRMKSEFLATMSHEIRTPLSGVVSLTDLLRDTDLDPAQRRLADGIAQAGRTMLGLVNDILDFSKIEAGKLDLETVDFEVRDVVEQAAGLVAESARLRAVDLVVACYPDVPRMLKGDPVRFGQIVTNLLSNAVKFTSEGQVRMRVTLQGSRGPAPMVRVEVSDTGIGIPVEAQATLFDSFTQADVSTTREYGGTGLGLSISRQLAEALGGEIGCTSEVGVGSTFWFTVPFLPAAEHAAAESTPTRTASPSVEPASGASLGVVLVAEDNLVNQLVARGVLEGLGYAVEFAQDGLEAVAAVTATPGRFLAVLMDCQMPRLDGYEATRVIRQLEEPGKRVPVIAMTASTVVGEKERCLDAGMDDFLVKPVDFELLESTLASWINAGVPPEAPAPTGPGDPFGVLDVTRIRMLQDLRPDDGSFFDRFVETFLGRVEYDVEAIETAVAEGDPPRLVCAAHVLKGSAQNLGAVELGRVCQALEDAGGRRDLTEARGQLPVLAEQVELTLKALRALT